MTDTYSWSVLNASHLTLIGQWLVYKGLPENLGLPVECSTSEFPQIGISSRHIYSTWVSRTYIREEKKRGGQGIKHCSMSSSIIEGSRGPWYDGPRTCLPHATIRSDGLEDPNLIQVTTARLNCDLQGWRTANLTICPSTWPVYMKTHTWVIGVVGEVKHPKLGGAQILFSCV